MKELLKDKMQFHKGKSPWDYDRYFYPHQVPNRGGGTFTVELTLSPVVWLTTNNVDERYLRSILPKFADARLLYQWEKKDVDLDPNGRPVVRGAIRCQIWDLRKVFGITTPLVELLGNDHIWLQEQGIELD